MSKYLEQINQLYSAACTPLRSSGVSERALDFRAPHIRGRRPGDARSEFLANRAMGDWAENALAASLNEALRPLKIVKYGNADDIVAGDPAFPDFFDNYHAELAASGKRPDLLAFSHNMEGLGPSLDISARPWKDLPRLARKALVAIETRSSKYFALEYSEIRKRQARLNPKFKGRMSQSFTPKVEDLKLVMRWINVHEVRHYYAQVFFDSVFLISFKRILEILATGDASHEIERNRNNQDKPTIHIPVTEGAHIGVFAEAPTFEAEIRKTDLARLDAYVVPKGGRLVLKEEKVRETLQLGQDTT